MKLRSMTLLLALAVVAAACGDDDGGDTTTTVAETTTTTAAETTTTTAAETTTTTAAETTTTTAAETTTTTAAVEGVTYRGADGVESVITDTSRVVTLSGDLTEIVYELGRGETVVAVDVTTTHPAEAAALPQVGFAQQLAPEAVLAFQPTLVLGDELTAPAESIEQLRATGVPVVILETQTTLDGVAPKIRDVAAILGVPAEGEALAERVQNEIDEARDLAAQAEGQPRVAYLYIRGPQVLLLFGQGMATNAMITGANAIDTAAETGIRGAVPLTPEALVAAAPEVLVLPEAGLGSLGGIPALSEIPGVGETPAGAEGNFLAYDEAYFFNLGPRAGQALREFVLDLHPELAGGS